MNPQRIRIPAADETPLAVWVEGIGPALVMIHGSIADHTTFEPFIQVLRESFTTYALDRRGFGATPDAAAYSIETDFADGAAVVDAVAERTGGPVVLFGHSYGANCAMGAAVLSGRVSHLILYEPSLGLKYPPGSIARIEAALARGDREAAIVAVLVDILELSEAEIDDFRANPLWPTRLACAATIPRECRVEESWTYAPGQFDAITVPTLMLTGSNSVRAVTELTTRAAAAIPNARTRVLDGHAHFAHKTDPVMVTEVIRQFISLGPSGAPSTVAASV